MSELGLSEIRRGMIKKFWNYVRNSTLVDLIFEHLHAKFDLCKSTEGLNSISHRLVVASAVMGR